MAMARVPSFPAKSTEPAVPWDTQSSSSHLFSSTISESARAFLSSTTDLQNAALVLAKRYLDPLANHVSEAQSTRLQAARRKRKRGNDDAAFADSILRMKEIHLEGFTNAQVWEQSKRILNASRSEADRDLANAPQIDGESQPPSSELASLHPRKSVRFQDVGSVSSSEPERDHDANLSDGLSGNDSEDQGLNDGPLEEDDTDLEDETDVNGLNAVDEDSTEDIEQDLDNESFEDEEPSSTFVTDKHGLNDGFFSIDDFNKSTEFLEQQDARGDPNDGAASDEEDIDWEADPFAQPSAAIDTSLQKKGDVADEEGPTFGDADLDTPWTSESENEEDDAEDIEMDEAANNANDIFYADFFAPPPRAASKGGNGRARPKKKPAPADEAITETDLQRTIDAVHRDIFSDDEMSEAEEVEGEEDASKPKLSTHERRQRALAAQIRTLEAEAVAKRQWTLSGEARAADRPVNSLLDEDVVLDFERAGKPVPAPSAAATESIEDLIKSRILTRNFDEIPKRRAGLDTLAPASSRRGLVELDDTKNKQSLAEIYETEHLRATDPNFVDARDAATKKAHTEIEGLWRDVAAKLDALTSWHYRPRPPDVEVSVVTNVPRAQIEDARPAGVAVGAEESRLAPQEVYSVGDGARKGKMPGEEGVLVTAGSGVVGRAELTREQKLRRRRREKERLKKGGNNDKTGAATSASAKDDGDKTGATGRKGSKKAQKERAQKNILDDLRRGEVKVIGKGGEVREVLGQKASVGGREVGAKSAGALKL